MVEVALHGAEFFAGHGYYPEEQLLGNKFILDIEVAFNTSEDGDDSLDNTLNYEQLYDIAANEMKVTRKLLETVAQAILEKIKTDYTFAESILVRLKKLAPPLKGRVEYSAVTVTYKK